MNSYFRTAFILVATIVVSMLLRWLMQSATGRAYDFPDGWFVGLCVGLGVVLGDRWRLKNSGAAPGNPPKR